jgi:5,10-methylene-tetrahydrofolate dehydrogenase/methenyl tetrahydrofolate cyclohydrolase
MPSTTSETELKKIKELNEDDDNIDGFIVQLPLPVQMRQKVLMAVEVKMLMDFILRILENGLRHEYLFQRPLWF